MADSNILRIGKISSINYPEGTARISNEDKDSSTSSELPFLAWEYWMPKIGDQVLVGHLSNGSCAGVIIGPVWHGDYQPADGREGVYRKEYSNEPGTANETYDAGAKAYSQTIDGTAEVTATESWTIQVGGCTIQANKEAQRRRLMEITGDGQAVKQELDSLIAIPLKSHDDSICIIRRYRHLEQIVKSLKHNDNNEKN